MEESASINGEGLETFAKLRPQLEKLFAEIVSRRKDAGISIGEAYFDLYACFLLGGGSAPRAVRSMCNPGKNVISPLEEIDSLERVIARPYCNSGASETKLIQIERYALRESHYLNYLGFNNEINKFFEVFRQLDSRLIYHSNNTSPSNKILQWLKGKKTTNIHRYGRKPKVKPKVLNWQL